MAVTSSDFFLPTATISALMTDSGATSESTKDAICIWDEYQVYEKVEYEDK